jgi:hypothetical protein
MTEILELKQGMPELKHEKRFVSLPGNGAAYPTENLIGKRGAPSKPTGDLQRNSVSQQESDTACLPLIQNWQAKPRKYRPHPAEQLVQIATSMLKDPSLLARNLQAFMNILTEWCTFKLEGIIAVQSHVGFKFPSYTDGSLFKVLHDESDLTNMVFLKNHLCWQIDGLFHNTNSSCSFDTINIENANHPQTREFSLLFL